MNAFSSDLIIIGAGPAGLALCRSLADSGLRIRLIEAQSLEKIENPAYDGREIALTHPSKQILTDLNIWQHIDKEQIFALKEAKVVNGDDAFELHFALPKTNSYNQPIDRLGFLVSNHLIRRAAYQACCGQAQLEWHLGKKVVSVQTTAHGAQVCLESGETFHAPLLVAADSRFSFVRQAVGIPTDRHDFGRTVIVFRLAHTLPNDSTAFECFAYGSTLALLPLSNYLTNCVITIDTHRADTLIHASGEALASFVSNQLKHRLGEMQLVETVHAYPLTGIHARRFYALRTALIGDAACGMHPVTAHGYNLGLQSQAILSRLLLRQHALGQDIGQTALLAQYSQQHLRNTLPLYHGTNAIVKLFTNESAWAKQLRKGVLRISNHLPPLKKIITRQLTG